MTAADSNVELDESIYTYDDKRIYTTISVTAREVSNADIIWT